MSTTGTATGGASALNAAASTALRRLSRIEYDNTLEDLLGDHTRSGYSKLPQETVTPDFAFDTNLSTQVATAPLISGAETLAQAAAARAFRDASVRAKLVSCTPTGPDDTACMKVFVARLGRLALRRALTDEEVDRYLVFQSFAVEQHDFYAGAELVLRAMLQEPEFLYRLEIGAQVPGQPGLFKLSGTEVATRLSYFLRGTAPSEQLLLLGETGQLATPKQLRAAAESWLADTRVRDRVQQFHAQWLSYERLQLGPELTASMQVETRALLDRVIFDKPSSYLDVFSSKETFIDNRLAELYGLPSPGAAAGWVPYGSAPRLGILSHGSVLAATTKPGDTSPTLRGRFISTRLMCRPIPPPPANVNIDTQPTADTTCKKQRLAAHGSTGSCAGCHSLMDPIGYGLENYDREGRYRTAEAGLPQCAISGEGSLPLLGAFQGVEGLAAALTKAGTLDDCVVRQIYRFAMGRSEADDESSALDSVVEQFKTNDRDFREALLGVVASPGFGLRRDATGEMQ